MSPLSSTEPSCRTGAEPAEHGPQTCAATRRGSVGDAAGTIDFVYLTSASHSGSTLLTLLLAGHADIATIGETSAVRWNGSGDTGLCSCGEPVGECGFWREVRERLARRGIDWSGPDFQTEFRLRACPLCDRVLRAEYQGPLLEAVRDTLLAVSPAWRRRRPELMRMNQGLIESVMEITGARVFLDSSKEPHRLKWLMRIPTFRTRIIQLIRDGRGVTCSYISRQELPAARAADEWRRSLISEEHVLKRVAPSDRLTIHYEALCRDVAGTIGTILDFLGLERSRWSSGTQAGPHHILGNRMRMQRSIEVRQDERWRRDMTPEDLAVFDKVAGDLNRRYGYHS